MEIINTFCFHGYMLYCITFYMEYIYWKNKSFIFCQCHANLNNLPSSISYWHVLFPPFVISQYMYTVSNYTTYFFGSKWFFAILTYYDLANWQCGDRFPGWTRKHLLVIHSLLGSCALWLLCYCSTRDRNFRLAKPKINYRISPIYSNLCRNRFFLGIKQLEYWQIS